jgi:hypothetical protein
LITRPRAIQNFTVRSGFRLLPGFLMRRVYRRRFLSDAVEPVVG